MKYEKYKDLYTQFLISEKNLSRNSVNNYLVDLDQFFFTDDIKASDLNAKIKSYITNLRKRNLKISSINRKISTLKNFLKFLHTEKIIEKIDFQEFESLSNNIWINKNLEVSTPGRICLFGEHQDYLGLPVIAMGISLRSIIKGQKRKLLFVYFYSF